MSYQDLVNEYRRKAEQALEAYLQSGPIEPKIEPLDFESCLADYKLRIETALETLPMESAPEPLRSAMRYSLLSGGKRLRGCMALAACDMLDGDSEEALPFACALEMIHAYSLIHDDLPAMDDAALRRGKPANHKVYGEAVAILAGDGLLTHAFEIMAASGHARAFQALGVIAQAAGIGGMLRGQTLDVTLEGTAPNRETVEQIHLGKTAALLTAPVLAGMTLAGAAEDQLAAGRAYGRHFGMAFQIVDDLLDIEGDAGQLGKAVGKDAQAGKLTWPACVGIEQARLDAEAHLAAAADALEIFGDRAEFLKKLAAYTLRRVQ